MGSSASFNQTGAGPGFHSDVNQAVSSAALMRPLFELEARRFYTTDDDISSSWDRLDLLWLAFAIMDVISELAEYQSGATRGEVLERLLPMVRRQALASGIDQATDEGLIEVLGKVFDHLANRHNRYLPFQYSWFDAKSGQFQVRRFWLIKNVYTGEGREPLFALTEEGYTAYFGLHETSALDATAIGNLRIKLLIERGNVDDAIAVADSNRKQCARKAYEVRNFRRQIRRNISGVDFAKVQQLTEEGVNQATTIQNEGLRLHNMVMESLTISKSDQRYEAKLHRLAEMLEHLNTQLMHLTTELQQLPDDYDKHSFKLFRRRHLGAFPPMEEVMRRICLLTEENAARIGEEFIAQVNPPAQRSLFDPASIIEACSRALDRQQSTGDRKQPFEEINHPSNSQFSSELSPRQMEHAFELMHHEVRSQGEISLSQLFQATSQPQGDQEDELLPVAMAMAVFQCTVEHRLAARHRVQVKTINPERRVTIDLCAGRRYRGHELRLIPLDTYHPSEDLS